MSAFWPVGDIFAEVTEDYTFNDRAIDQVRKLQQKKRSEEMVEASWWLQEEDGVGVTWQDDEPEMSDIDGLIEAQEEVIKIAEEAIFKLNELKKLIK